MFHNFLTKVLPKHPLNASLLVIDIISSTWALDIQNKFIHAFEGLCQYSSKVNNTTSLDNNRNRPYICIYIRSIIHKGAYFHEKFMKIISTLLICVTVLLGCSKADPVQEDLLNYIS